MVKLLILGLFIVVGFLTINPADIAPSFKPDQVSGTLYASVIFFLSYMGFGLIANTSENMKNPHKNVPRAIFISIAIVMVIYIGVSLAALVNLPVKEIIKAKENALAIASEPFLGKFGYLLISIGALFSISSALNATIYGGANISYSLAKDGELPKIFERKLWFKSREGLFITSGLSVLFLALFDLAEIASITSSVFTIIYIFVIFSHFRIAEKYGGNKIVIIINLLIILAVFISLVYYQYINQRSAFYGTLSALSGAVLLEYIYRKLRKRIFIDKI
jgi:amino acid transporter